MELTPTPSAISASRRTNLLRCFATGLGSVLIGILIGWIAFQLQQAGQLPDFLFPILFPLLVGSLAGGAMIVIANWLHVRHRKFLVACLLLGCLCLLATQAFSAYRVYCDGFYSTVERSPHALLFQDENQPFKPASFGKFLQAQIDRSGGWWYFDAALTIVACLSTGLFIPQRLNLRNFV